MSAVTQWFGPDDKPVHVGAYNASVFKSKYCYRYWNGKNWSIPFSLRGSASEIEYAKLNESSESHPIYWRGLADKP
jgi:hypothetical protein